MTDKHTAGALARLWRRVQLAVGRGRVTTSNDSGSVQMLQAILGQLETRDKIPRMAEFGFTSRPPYSSDVIVLFVGGDRSNGVAVATGHQASRPVDLLEGETQVYNLFGRRIYLHTDRVTIDGGGGPVEVINSTVVTVNASQEIVFNTPLLQVNGDIIATGDITDKKRSMAADRVIFNEHTNGSGTSTPTPTQ